MTTNSRDILAQARDAFSAEKYSEALEKYSYFFDHALDDDPHSLYGVRLSYCLKEWAKLGEKYPEALFQLIYKRDATLRELEETKLPEKFHDYISICKYLKCDDMAINQFINIHEKDRKLAETIIGFIWDDLVEHKLWNICIEYLDDPIEKYEHSLLKFDQTMSLCKSDPSLGGDEFEDQIKDWYIRDVSNLILVLKNNNRAIESEKIMNKSKEDLKSRKYSELIEALSNLTDPLKSL